LDWKIRFVPNPTQFGEMVSFDDCKKANGILFELKGEGYTKLTKDLPRVMVDRFIDQATRQLAASGGRPIVWIFAEDEAARFARKLFDSSPDLKRITVGYVPWTRSGR
jgi:NADPH-dependent ferric siderophore reductase